MTFINVVDLYKMTTLGQADPLSHAWGRYTTGLWSSTHYILALQQSSAMQMSSSRMSSSSTLLNELFVFYWEILNEHQQHRVRRM